MTKYEKKTVLSVILAVALVLSLAGCGTAGGQTFTGFGENITVGDIALRPEGEAGRLYDNGGIKLLIPLEYEGLLQTETLQDDKDGLLFRVSEIASIEAAKAAGYGVDGAGWLFSIGRVDEARLHEMLCYDMSGAELFAKGSDGSCYIYYHPTDVRYVRENSEAMARDQELWTLLTEWAGTVRDSMLAENPELSAMTRGNSMLDMCLARAAYMDGVNYTVSTTEFGPLEPGGVAAAPYAERLMTGNGVAYEDAGIDEAPDGEYVVLNFPDDDVRFDFFLAAGGENHVRQIWSGDNEMLCKAVFTDDTKASAVMQEWYDALAAEQGLK